MYIPDDFRQKKLPLLLEFIEHYPFATLVSSAKGVPVISEVPLMYQASGSGDGQLLGHLARNNPHCAELECGAECVAVFHGPQGYVSPGWYQSPGVPTWNYASVYVRGTARVINDSAELVQCLNSLTATFESKQDRPWEMALPADKRERLLSSIVGFKIDISTIEGKFKLSQNRPEADQLNVMEQLANSALTTDQALSVFMRDYRKT